MRIFCQQFSKRLLQVLKEMPKEQKHIPQLQKQRIKHKERITKYSPGTVNLVFLTPSPGSTSAYLFTDQSRYLFNCGEGTQRLAHEHRTKLTRLEHIFMTRTSWSTIGGLPGLCLTVQEAGVPEITLHGPPGLDDIFKATRRFVVLRDLKVNAVECQGGGVYDDCALSVDYVPLYSDRKLDEVEEETTLTVDNEDYYAHERGIKLETGKQFVEKLTKRLEHSVIAYVCKLKHRAGTLDLSKCVEKGVPTGHLLGQLKNGFDVVLPDGTTVRSKDVRGPDDPGPKFIFIDIPNEDYLADLELKTKLFTDDPALVVHFTQPKMLAHPKYKEFLTKFPPSCEHLLANGMNSFSGYVAAHRIQWQLNQLDAQIFPLLGEAQNIDEGCESLRKKARLESTEEKPEMESKGPQTVNTLSLYHLRPSRGLDRTSETTLNPSEYLKELETIDEFQTILKQVRDEFPQRDRTIYPKILFLGTGSCIPNKTRNVSAILVRINAENCILLDCGEGTVGQIYRFFGYTEAANIFKGLRAIYVSHLHADHHLGLIGLILERRKYIQGDRLTLYAPNQISYWLKFYENQIESIESDFYLVPNGSLLDTSAELPFGGQIRTCLVHHCPHSFGVALQLPTDIKITYSGDTVPCQNLVDLGKDSTLLIHEATMENDLAIEAQIKMHSTVSQAIRQGQLMNAKYTILTHFSQRYSKLPRFEFETLDENVGIAFDNMEVTLADLPILHKLYPAFKRMFTEHVDEMDQRAKKREQKKKLAESRNSNS